MMGIALERPTHMQGTGYTLPCSRDSSSAVLRLGQTEGPDD